MLKELNCELCMFLRNFIPQYLWIITKHTCIVHDTLFQTWNYFYTDKHSCLQELSALMVLPLSYIYKALTGNVHSYAMRNLKCSFGLPGLNRSGRSSHSAPFKAVQDQISIFRLIYLRRKNHSPRYRVFSASLGMFRSYITRKGKNVYDFRVLDRKLDTLSI